MTKTHLLTGAAASVVGLGVWMWGNSVGYEQGRQELAAHAAEVPTPPAPTADALPSLVRPLLTGRMGRHASSTSELLVAALRLDYARAEALANQIGAEPMLARPSGEGDTVNDAVPAEFFSFQEALTKNAGSIAAAARARDPDTLSVAFGGLTQSCMQCHARFGGGLRTTQP